MALVCKTSLGSLQWPNSLRPPHRLIVLTKDLTRAVASQALFTLNVEMWTKQSL